MEEEEAGNNIRKLKGERESVRKEAEEGVSRVITVRKGLRIVAGSVELEMEKLFKCVIILIGGK